MARIQYYSTNLGSEKVSFREALIRGQAPDRGLYMPEQIPVLTQEQIQSFANKSYAEIAETILKLFVNDDIPHDELSRLVRDAYNFEIPLENVYDRVYVMRLDRGPTASFKDFAARMMGRLMQYFLKQENRRMLILTATSGDTGSAIANAFYDLDNIEV
ncbi:MAG: threonine synthase, partial [Bacteroidales bacterium]